MWLIQDETPPHLSVIVREHLKKRYNEFFASGYLKSLVYSTEIDHVTHFQKQIEYVCQIIQLKPVIFKNMRNSFTKSCESWRRGGREICRTVIVKWFE